ncbi:MAG: homocysteine S-methyltransferase family protein [Oscillospiraceae bacterium]|nr:homocysteine S-methyltransferase family protein [Oscillospiraceae bacterium]
MKGIGERLGREWLICDGGTGTFLQERGLSGGELPETWNLLHPDIVGELNRKCFEAGADIVNTNTFGANRLKFGDKLEQIVTAAVDIAKKARHDAGRDNDAYVALDIGPTGKLLEPMGDLSFDSAVEIFSEIVKIGAGAGADLVLIETMSDGYESKAALLAAKENCDLPVIVTNVYDNNGRLLTGGTVETTVAMLEGLGADAVGVNCGLGPLQMIPIVKRLINCASVPVVVNPNAGLPQMFEGKTYFDVGPEEFLRYMEEIAAMGVQVCGGCCGTTPDHIRLLADNIKKRPFVPQTQKDICMVTSYSQGVEIGKKTVIIGERINPTGKKRFKQALRENDIDYILNEGLRQEDQGAHILDVNVGLPEINEPEMMEKVVKALQGVTTLPLQIDTTDITALERAMRIYNGKPMINSVNGKQEVIDSVMPLVAKYGGVLVALVLDEDGIPNNAEDRIRIAKKIYEAADKYGIPRKDIVIDGLCMTISSDTSSAAVTLETLRRVRDELHGNTILGVSNISFGLPARELINSNFLTMAMQNGLSCAIMNPGNEPMMQAYYSTNALLDKDEQCMDFIGRYQSYVPFSKLGEVKADTGAAQTAADEKSQASGGAVAEAVRRGMKEGAAEETKKALKTRPSLEIIDNELIPALDDVGKGFEKGKVFLPQLLMSADAAKAAFEVIKSSMQGSEQNIKAKVILATVKGDIHDIGKNIVKVMMENYGYKVIDLGKDVPPEVIVETAIKEDIKLVGLSALMTTTVVSMEETIKLLREKKPDCKVAVGGAVMTQEYADAIGADFYGKDAMATVRYADSLFGA